MKELTHNAKIAVLKILNDIVNADNIVKDVEGAPQAFVDWLAVQRQEFEIPQD